jgi:tetratricopeptide (TPR) repeat protein
MATLGYILDKIGLLEEGEKLLTKAVRKAELQAEDLQLLEYKVLLALVLQRQERLEEAEGLGASIVENVENSLNQYPHVVLSATEVVAACQSLSGKHKEALKTWEMLVQSFRQDFGEKSSLTISAMFGLGNCLFQEGQISAATTVLRDVYDLQREIREPVIHIISTAEMLSKSYERQGNFHDSENLTKSVNSLATQVLGAAHPQTIQSKITLAYSYLYRYKVKDAEETLISCIESLRDLENNEDSLRLMSINSAFSRLLSVQGKTKASIERAQKALQICQSIRGLQHPHTISCATNFIGIQMSTALTAELESQALENIQLSVRVLGSRNRHTLRAKIDLAGAYMRCNRYTDAELLFMELDAVLHEVGDQLEVATMCGRRAEYSLRRGEIEKTVELEERALHIRKTILGPENPATLVTMSNLATSYSCQKNYAAAEDLLKKVVELRERLVGRNSLPALKSRQDLATIQFFRGNTVDSERSMRAVVDGYTAELGLDAGETKHAHALLTTVTSEKREECRMDLYETRKG